MTSEQFKIAVLLIGVMSVSSLFMATGNEIDYWKLKAEHDSLQIDFDSLKIRIECENVGWFILDAKVGRNATRNSNSNSTVRLCVPEVPESPVHLRSGWGQVDYEPG